MLNARYITSSVILSILSVCTLWAIWQQIHSGATHISEKIGDAEIDIVFTPNKVMAPDGCVNLEWDINSAKTIYGNHSPLAETGREWVCREINYPYTLDVQLIDGNIHRYIIEPEVIPNSLLFWLSIVMLCGSLATLIVLWGHQLWEYPIRNGIMIFCGLVFTMWAVVFISVTSYVSPIDGNRYFALFDDAMISMRFAWNATQGNGLVWSLGERVEGYTNTLLVLYMMLVLRFVSDLTIAPLVIQATGIGFILASAVITVRIADLSLSSQVRNKWQLVFVFLAVITYYPLIYWSLMGMETGLLSVLYLLSILLVFEYDERPRKWIYWLLPIITFCAYLTRPEYGFFGLLVLGYFYYQLLRTDTWRQGLYKLVPALLLFFCLVGGHIGWRYIYYGELFPNTYYLKVSTNNSELMRIHQGLLYTRNFLQETWFLLLFGTLGVFAYSSPRKSFLGSMFLMMLLYQVYVGGDPWNYWRFTAPLIPTMAILFVDFTFTFHKHTRERYRSVLSQKSLIPFAAFALSLSLVTSSVRLWNQALFQTVPYSVDWSREWINEAVALRELVTPEARLGLMPAGIMSYYTEHTYLYDFLGKSDSYIAKETIPRGTWRGGHNKQDFAYSITQLQPDYIYDCFWRADDFCEYAEQHYFEAKYDGLYREVYLQLLRDSPDIQWDKVSNQSERFD